MPDLEQMLAEARAKEKKKKFSRGLRPDHLTRGYTSPTLSGASTLDDANPAVANSTIAKVTSESIPAPSPLISKEENATAKTTIAELAIESYTIASSAMENSAVAKNAIAKNSGAAGAIANIAIQSLADHAPTKSASQTSTIAKITTATNVMDNYESNAVKKSTQVEYIAAKTTIAALADKKNGYTRVDNFIFDSVIPTIENPAAALLYLYLWRRTIGFQKTWVELSHQILSDAIGVSKRTVQEAVAILNEKGLIKTTRAYSTAIPKHVIQKPWQTAEQFLPTDAVANFTIAENTVADVAIAQSASSYSENCQFAIAEVATTKRKDLNKENKYLSLPEIFETHLRTLTATQAKREREHFDNLSKQFHGEEIEIAKALQYLVETGTDLSGTALRSPMGLLVTSYPQIRDFLREKNNGNHNNHAHRDHIVQMKVQILEKEQSEDKEFKKREEAFLRAFPSMDQQRGAILEWTRLASWITDLNGPVARHFAINAWCTQNGEQI